MPKKVSKGEKKKKLMEKSLCKKLKRTERIREKGKVVLN
jgi:hypothetical protein